QQIAELIMGFDEIRVALDRGAKCRLRLLVAPQRAQREAEAVADVGLFRRERRRALDMGEGGRRIARTEGDDAAQMPGGAMPLSERKQRPAGRFCLFQPALRLLGMRAGEQLTELRGLCRIQWRVWNAVARIMGFVHTPWHGDRGGPSGSRQRGFARLTVPMPVPTCRAALQFSAIPRDDG